MDPRSKLYNTKLTKEELLEIFDNSFNNCIGGYDWESEVRIDFQSREDGILIGEACKIMDAHSSAKMVRFANTPIDRFKESVRKKFREINS
jgi:hypothetical protein